MPHIFRSLFSDRYNGKIERFYDRYEEVCKQIPNMPPMPRPGNKTSAAGKLMIHNNDSKAPGKAVNQTGHAEPSQDWRMGDDIPIVVRRELELEYDIQLMATQPQPASGCSHMIWELQPENSDGKDETKNIDKKVLPKSDAGVTAEKGIKSANKLQIKPAELTLSPSALEMRQPGLVKKIDRRRCRQPGEFFQCDVCHRKFEQSWMLVGHKRVHSGERPFVCPEQTCQKSFADRSNLRSHQRSLGHHKWQHQCGQCGKYFSQDCYLARHGLDACRKYLLSALHKKS